MIPTARNIDAPISRAFDNIWHHGDFAEWTEHGGLIIHGRSDATLNPGGVRIGTAEIYRQVEQLEEVQESIVIGQDWEHDVRVVLFVVLKPGLTLDAGLRDRIKSQIRTGASPRHVPARIIKSPTFPVPSRARSPSLPFARSCTAARSRTRKRLPIRRRSSSIATSPSSRIEAHRAGAKRLPARPWRVAAALDKPSAGPAAGHRLMQEQNRHKTD